MNDISYYAVCMFTALGIVSGLLGIVQPIVNALYEHIKGGDKNDI